MRIKDLEFIRRTYFFLADHPVGVDFSTLRLYRDDRIPGNNIVSGAVPGLARLDPTLRPSASNPEFAGHFDVLTPGVDYAILTLWLPRAPGQDTPVIKLRAPLALTDILAAVYVDDAGPVTVGTLTPEEFAAEDTALAKPANMLLLKSLKIPSTELLVGLNGFYDPASPWYPTLFFELRNLYDLSLRDIDPKRLRVKVRRFHPGLPEDPDSDWAGRSFLQILGLDQRGLPASSDPLTPDGHVDQEFIDYERGLLFFPDLHPFDPGLVGDGCPPGYGGFLCLDCYLRNTLRRDSPDSVSTSNPIVYFAPNPDPFADTRFYIEATLLPPPPLAAVLHQNAPNPFNPETRIRFDLLRDAHVRISVYDVHGRFIEVLADRDFPEGTHEVAWSGLDRTGGRAPSGVYYYALDLGEGVRYSRRMVLVR